MVHEIFNNSHYFQDDPGNLLIVLIYLLYLLIAKLRGKHTNKVDEIVRA